jgi:hypothetical protein
MEGRINSVLPKAAANSEENNRRWWLGVAESPTKIDMVSGRVANITDLI